MNRFFAVIIVCLCFYACKPGIPKDIIQPDKMEKVLFDIHITDGYIGTILNPDTAKMVASAYYKGIYKKFNIDSAVYNRSLSYYYHHPDVLKTIYDKLMKQLEQARTKNEKSEAKEAEMRHQRMIAERIKPLRVPSEKPDSLKFEFTENPFTLLITIK